jgi:hypothetical protein
MHATGQDPAGRARRIILTRLDDDPTHTLREPSAAAVPQRVIDGAGR